MDAAAGAFGLARPAVCRSLAPGDGAPDGEGEMRRITMRELLIGGAFCMLAAAGLAQGIRTEPLGGLPEGGQRVLEGSLTGDEVIDYVVSLSEAQVLSVDLQSANPAASFNILPAAGDSAIFVGSTEGKVADLTIPAAGDYLIRLYLMRDAAQREETAPYALGIGIGTPDPGDGAGGGPDFWAVAGLSGSGTLNLRAGPSTRYSVVGTLRNGDVLENRGCRGTGRDRWCRIRATGSGVTGWTAGQYLVETASPARPSVPGGGQLGNGLPFDATGQIACRAVAEQSMTLCPFGVIRHGAGNAGVWIGTGDGRERQLLFEAGTLVASTPDAPFEILRRDDTTIVTVADDVFEIPDAVINGG